jgi:hypothetical protein
MPSFGPSKYILPFTSFHFNNCNSALVSCFHCCCVGVWAHVHVCVCMLCAFMCAHVYVDLGTCQLQRLFPPIYNSDSKVHNRIRINLVKFIHAHTQNTHTSHNHNTTHNLSQTLIISIPSSTLMEAAVLNCWCNLPLSWKKVPSSKHENEDNNIVENIYLLSTKLWVIIICVVYFSFLDVHSKFGKADMILIVFSLFSHNNWLKKIPLIGSSSCVIFV